MADTNAHSSRHMHYRLVQQCVCARALVCVCVYVCVRARARAHTHTHTHTHTRTHTHCSRLIQRLDILPQYLEMSKVTGVTMNDLNTRGQQIKVFTQIVREARISDFVLPDMRGGPSSGGSGPGNDVQYTGAFVLPPTRGMYQEPIATLDFASLYPSIIRGDNLSYETLVYDEAELEEGTPVSKIHVEQGALWDVHIGVAQGSTRLRGATDDPVFMRMIAKLQPGMKVILGTTKKTDPVEGEAIPVHSVDHKAASIQLVSPVSSVSGEVTIKRLKVVVEHVYTYVQVRRPLLLL